MKPFFVALAKNKKLDGLDLGFNFLGVEGAMSICEILDDNNSLTSVDLSSNNLQGDELGKEILKALNTNQTIVDFKLKNNDLPQHILTAIDDHLANLKVEGKNIEPRHIEDKFRHVTRDHEQNKISDMAGSILAHKFYQYNRKKKANKFRDEDMMVVIKKIQKLRNQYPFSEIIIEYLAKETETGTNVQTTVLEAFRNMLQLETTVAVGGDPTVTIIDRVCTDEDTVQLVDDIKNRNEADTASVEASANADTNSEINVVDTNIDTNTNPVVEKRRRSQVIKLQNRNNESAKKRHKALFVNLIRLCSSDEGWVITLHDVTFELLNRVSWRRSNGTDYREDWILHTVQKDFVHIHRSLHKAVRKLNDCGDTLNFQERMKTCKTIKHISKALNTFTREYDGSSKNDSRRVREVMSSFDLSCVEALVASLRLYPEYRNRPNFLHQSTFIDMLSVLTRALRHGLTRKKKRATRKPTKKANTVQFDVVVVRKCLGELHTALYRDFFFH